MTAVLVKNVSKRFGARKYRLGWFGRGGGEAESGQAGSYVLQDINLEVSRGEFLGIMGQNGAGKSTLLRIISGALYPTHGSVQADAPVRILDLGSGMNPAMSGRSNTVSMALAAGMSKQWIDALMDEVIEFSGLGHAIDDPQVTYSTGMTMRLAFSLHVHLDASVLIIDEAFAVGDARFVLKCTQKLRELSDRGTTVLFASHDANAIMQLCDRAILLDSGRIAYAGSPAQTVEGYYSLLGLGKRPSAGGPERPAPVAEAPSSVAEFMKSATPWSGEEFHSRDVAILGARMYRNGSESAGPFSHGDSCEIQWLLQAGRPVDCLTSGIHIYSKTGAYVYGTSYVHLDRPLRIERPGYLLLGIRFPMALGPGDYLISIGAAEPNLEGHSIDGVQLDRFVHAFEFTVTDFTLNPSEPVPFFGMIDLPAEAVPPVEMSMEPA